MFIGKTARLAHVFKNKLDVLEKLNALFDRKEKFQFAVVMGVALAAALFQALGVASVLPFVELVMNPEMAQQSKFFNPISVFFRFESSYAFTMFMGFAILGILVVGNCISAFAEWFRIRFVWQKSHAISTALLRKYLSLSYVYFLNTHSAELSKNIVFEVQEFTNNLLMPLLQIITKGIVVSIIVVLLLFVHPTVAFGSASIFVFSYLLIFSFLRRSLKANGVARLRENTGRFIAAGEAFAGIKDIKALGREDYFLKRFSDHSARFSRLQAWTSVAIQLPKYLMEIVAFGGVIALILVFLSLRQESSQIIPLISFFVFAGYRLMPAFQSMFQAASDIQFTRAILDKLSEDMRESQVVVVEGKALPEPLAFREQIEFEEVSFRYPYTKEPALQNISFQIPRGSVVGFVGPTGGGKTTLIDIFIGLLAPEKGRLTVDGVAVNGDNMRNWQRNLGYVPQQIFLSDDTIWRNVAFGLENVDMAQVIKACTIANIHDFITRELPQGYETMIGERGVRLSGGQRQRLGIARALYHDPEVLVLDEATNALDGVMEQSVLEAIQNIAKFKTLVLVAHRLTTVQHCDMIYFIEKGRIAAIGTYGNLLKTNAQFRAMAREPKNR